MRKSLLSILILLTALSVSKAQDLLQLTRMNKDSASHDYAFNLLIGNSTEINKMELGLFINTDKKNVKSFQAAGFVNAVGGKMTGCQLAGFGNFVNDSLHGAQLAGFMNFVNDSVKGAQLAGFLNVSTGSIRGAQFAGYGNYAKNVVGLQASAGINVASGSDSGLQAAGVGNFSKSTTGAQLAGVINCTSYLKKGLQIAPFNYADSSNGVPIGLLSIVMHNGYHKIEVSSDELFSTNLSFRTGVESFHNIITVGIRPENIPNVLWTFGYGIGTSFRIANGVHWDLDISANHISRTGSTVVDGWSDIYKLYTGVDLRVIKGFSIAAGPALNVFVVDNKYSNELPASNWIHSPNNYDQKAGDSNRIKAWIGGKIAIRFL